jgi:hypothetical protein
VRQAKSGKHKGVTVLNLEEGAFDGAPSYSECTRAAGDSTTRSAASKSQTLQTLNTTVHDGALQTNGRYSSSTSRSAVFATADRCDGTMTIVTRGTVYVYDRHTHKTITVTSGHRYLATG